MHYYFKVYAFLYLEKIDASINKQSNELRNKEEKKTKMRKKYGKQT